MKSGEIEIIQGEENINIYFIYVCVIICTCIYKTSINYSRKIKIDILSIKEESGAKK